MSYILLQIGDKPMKRLTLPVNTCIFRESESGRFPKLHLKYGYIHPNSTFHVYMYAYPKNNRKYHRLIEKVFLCDQFHTETNIWTGQADIDPNDFVEDLFLFDIEDLLSFSPSNMHIGYNFKDPISNTISSLQALSTCVIGNSLQKNEDIQRLPLPKLLKTRFSKHYFEASQNSLRNWFLCDEKKPLFYFGSPGTYKLLDIHEFTLDKSICFSGNINSITPDDEYIILSINIYNYVCAIDFLVDIVKTFIFQDIQQHYSDHKIKARLIIISDYAPEILLNEYDEKEWILNTFFVVKKECLSFPKKFTHCFKCKKNIYLKNITWFKYKPYHEKCHKGY